MRKAIFVALAITASASVAADAQAPAPAPAAAWQSFSGANGIGASVKGAGGTLIVKCDKPGKKEVYAMILSDASLAVPSQRPPARPIATRFDGKAPEALEWRFYEKYATALGKTGDRNLARFIVGLRKASKVDLRLDTGIASDVVMSFDVTGAREAVTQVYTSCNDTAPA